MTITNYCIKNLKMNKMKTKKKFFHEVRRNPMDEKKNSIIPKGRKSSRNQATNVHHYTTKDTSASWLS